MSETPATSKRLALLEKLTQDKTVDPFHWYGLAMEYRSLGRAEDALRTFATLRASNPDYIAMYLMCGQLLAGLGRTEDARGWYEGGIATARKKGDSHALSELETALAALA